MYLARNKEVFSPLGKAEFLLETNKQTHKIEKFNVLNNTSSYSKIFTLGFFSETYFNIIQNNFLNCTFIFSQLILYLCIS